MRFSWLFFAVLICVCPGNFSAQTSAATADEYASRVRPLLRQYCFTCHSAEKHKGSLNLERFETLAQVRRDLKPWQAMIEMVEAGEMPPKGKPQPSAQDRKRLLAWVHEFLNAEALARAGDPGFVPLRRLSNAEYNYTIRDLTGVDLQPAREFPADGAAGEGFTNAAEALADMSPTLLNKYLNSAKEIAAHAVLLPDGFRFSQTRTRRDWTNECMVELREFYSHYTGEDGRLPIQPYLAATVRHRDALATGKMTIEEAAAKEKLNAKYLGILWQALSGRTASFPLDMIRARWRTASEKDVSGIVADISTWQTMAWKTARIGSYRDHIATRELANDPAANELQTVRLAVKPAPGQNEVTVYLSTSEFTLAEAGRNVIWRRPRFEAAKKPTLLLHDYSNYGPAYEVDYAAIFAGTSKYLAAAVEIANDRNLSPDDVALKSNLNPNLLKRWIDLLAVEPSNKAPAEVQKPDRVVDADRLKLLEDPAPHNASHPGINGWKRNGNDLPAVMGNSSDKIEHIPGVAAAHQVVVHPMPMEYVAVVWKSPIDGNIRLAAHIAHVHRGCGNGIAWWIERRHRKQAAILSEGVLDVGQETQAPARTLAVAKGDQLILAVDARDGNHVCDLTQLTFTLSDVKNPGRIWDLAADVADNISEGNPHSDKLGNKNVWSFVEGPSKPGRGTTSTAQIPASSLLGKWRIAACDADRHAEAIALAEQAQHLFAGPRPMQGKDPNLVLYDNLVSGESPLLKGLDLARFPKAQNSATHFGLTSEQFAHHPPADDASLVASASAVIEIHLPAAIFAGHEFVVDCALEKSDADRVVQFHATAAPPAMPAQWDGNSPIVASTKGAAYKQMLAGMADFRQCFPSYICYPHIIPVDEVVCLKQFHRDDDQLCNLFLEDAQKARLDRLWEEHRFISQWPISENRYLPLFIGFVTQDQPKELLAFYEGFREPFRKRAEAFEQEIEGATPKQLAMLFDFASRAFRRPLRDSEKAEILGLYQSLRGRGVAGDEAFRGILARVLVSPSFLFRLEQPPAGKQPGPVNDWELATRLSYFLWATTPNVELRGLAATGRLHDPQILAQQTRRMLKDDRIRALAIEFGTQWIHVRGFDEFKEKNEKLFPTFDEKLRSALYEESILFFQDLFQIDQPVNRILDADYTYLNEPLARHYAIPGVSGVQFRKVEGVRKYGRGGILGLGSVQSKQAGASRTSPVLRGNWVVETLLGEKLPRPPPDVPKLPEEEGQAGLTTRQMVEKHTSVASCRVCHQRIDPIGFTFENYDPIGRFREKETSGLAIDCRGKLKDGTELEGIDGLRKYLLTQKRDVVVRLFCRRLLGYGLGRAVILSDQATIDEMVAALNRPGGRLSDAVLTIVRSKQFQSIRGSEFSEEE